MNKLKHTKGKWQIRTTVDNSGDYPFPTYDIIAIHDYGPEGVSTAYQNPYNAHLIAAAPEMLDALIEQTERIIKMVNIVKTESEGLLSDIYFENKEIIEKATGLSIEEVLK